MNGEWLRRAWRASAHPGEFFTGLGEEPELTEVLPPALLAIALGSSVFAWAVARGTSSDAWAAVLLIVVPGALLYAATLWLLGGLALARTAALDVRGWEIAAWAWVPSGFVALGLLPVVAVFPVTSLIVGMLGLPFWHLAVVRAGLLEFAPNLARRALFIYALVVLVIPVGAIALSLLLLLGTPRTA